MNKEIKQLSIEIKSISEDETGFFQVSGYAIKWFGVDTYNDSIVPGATAKTISKALSSGGLPVLFMHDARTIPVGVWYEFVEDQIGLFVKCRLPKEDSLVSGRIVPQIKAGSINALSIGFYPMKYRFEEREDAGIIRILEEIDLLEISLITKGYQADSGALLTEIKRRDNRTAEEDMFNAMIEAKRKGCTESVKNQIIEFYHEKAKGNPFESDAVLSIEELKSLTISNKVYAIRKVLLSTKTAQYLADLVTIQSKRVDSGSESQESPSTDEKKEVTFNTDLSVEDVLPEVKHKELHNVLDRLLETLTK